MDKGHFHDESPQLWRKLGLKLNASTFHSSFNELVSFTVVIKSKQSRKKSSRRKYKIQISLVTMFLEK